MDVRDKTTWVTLGLTKVGEQKAIDGTLESSVRSSLGIPDSHQVFVPYASYSKGSRKVSVKLIEGYCFVASGLPETRYFSLEKGPFVAKVMTSPGPYNTRALSVVPDSKIREMMSQLRGLISSDIEMGARVKVVGGSYLHLDGVVVDLTEDRVAVRIQLRSLDVVAWLPKVFVVDASTNSGDDTEVDPLDIAVGSEFLPEE